MRVLLTTDPIGGVWTFTVELSQELLRLGHSVHLLSFGRALSPSQAEWCLGTAGHAGNAFSWEVTLAPLEWMQDNERAWDSGAAAISHAIADFRPEILHANQFCFGYTDASLPCVITAHSDVLSWAEACRPSTLR